MEKITKMNLIQPGSLKYVNWICLPGWWPIAMIQSALLVFKVLTIHLHCSPSFFGMWRNCRTRRLVSRKRMPSVAGSELVWKNEIKRSIRLHYTLSVSSSCMYTHMWSSSAPERCVCACVSACVCACACVCMCVRVYVCVWERERERGGGGGTVAHTRICAR